MKASYLICGLYVLMSVVCGENRGIRVYFDDFVVKYKAPDIFVKMDSNLTQSNNRSYINLEVILKKDVNDINVRLSMEFWKPNAKAKMKLYDVRVDGCQLLRSIHQNKLFNVFVKSFKKHANVILMCPLKANYSYKMVNWFLDENDLPAFVPVGKFRTLTEYYTQQRLGIRIVASGDVLAKH
ncbi:uncharacterized protein LOC108032331 [Drosophila biarmipes]|uniref:uncharacterized protein LOC108032331 n=1 Tax=Drosophila biarmipes TaxID=125945 RepID=UPI0007E7D0AA|nr:uncharacterized protein LOC108032331 [Drosophila biarmipes]